MSNVGYQKPKFILSVIHEILQLRFAPFRMTQRIFCSVQNDELHQMSFLRKQESR